MSEPQHPTPCRHRQRTGQAIRPRPHGSGGAASCDAAGASDSMAAVGARLAQLRKAKGWSIDDVSARLKVSPHKVRALEAGDISHLPDTHVRAGIVRSYAKMLGADPAPFTQALRRAKGALEHESVDAGFVGRGFAARHACRCRSAARAQAPLVAVGRCGGDRRGDRARDVAHRRRFDRVARAPEGERERRAGGVDRRIGTRSRAASAVATPDEAASARRIPAKRRRRKRQPLGDAADAASARHQRAAGFVVDDRGGAGRERRRRRGRRAGRARRRRLRRSRRLRAPAVAGTRVERDRAESEAGQLVQRARQRRQGSILRPRARRRHASEVKARRRSR